MRNGNRMRVVRRILSSPITIALILVLVFFLGRAAWNMHKTAELAQSKLSQAQAGLEQLQSQQADLSAAVNSMSTQAGIEAELRTKYPAVKPGESVAVIVDNSSSTPVSTATPSSEQSESWWGRVMQDIGL